MKLKKKSVKKLRKNQFVFVLLPPYSFIPIEILNSYHIPAGYSDKSQ